MKYLIKEDRIFRREFPGYDSRDSEKISVILGWEIILFAFSCDHKAGPYAHRNLPE